MPATPDLVPIRRALISVSDKTGIVELARALAELGVELLSTGGTHALLSQQGLAVTEVADVTGFPELMDGRVKTLHPKIHGGLLGRRDVDEAAMAEHGIPAIDLVVVNLYPFERTVAQPDCSLAEAIENIDIGGPAMLRAAAKNHAWVTTLVRTGDYQRVLQELRSQDGQIRAATRLDLATRAFEHTAGYDGAIANYLSRQGEQGGSPFGRSLHLQLHKQQDLRYGENPHQRAAFYVEPEPVPATLGTTVQLQGKALSYNNIADTDAALECVKQFQRPACVIVKHANPCGVAQASDLLQAYELAFATDSESAFGGIIAFNRELDGATAAAIVERQFVEVIIAPTISQAAREAVAAKENVRLLACGPLVEPQPSLHYHRVGGGLLVQDRDLGRVEVADLKVVSRRQPDATELDELLFAWRVARFVKSNAIVYTRDQRTIGVGAGQMSRVNSARIAAIKAEHAGLEVRGAVMASDAFFPFRDGIDHAAAAGIRSVIQPGGSIRDEEVIAAADEHGMAMVFTGMRHFRH